jgi:hypothetical protein
MNRLIVIIPPRLPSRDINEPMAEQTAHTIICHHLWGKRRDDHAFHQKVAKRRWRFVCNLATRSTGAWLSPRLRRLLKWHHFLPVTFLLYLMFCGRRIFAPQSPCVPSLSPCRLFPPALLNIARLCCSRIRGVIIVAYGGKCGVKSVGCILPVHSPSSSYHSGSFQLSGIRASMRSFSSTLLPLTRTNPACRVSPSRTRRSSLPRNYPSSIVSKSRFSHSRLRNPRVPVVVGRQISRTHGVSAATHRPILLAEIFNFRRDMRPLALSAASDSNSCVSWVTGGQLLA